MASWNLFLGEFVTAWFPLQLQVQWLPFYTTESSDFQLGFSQLLVLQCSEGGWNIKNVPIKHLFAVILANKLQLDAENQSIKLEALIFFSFFDLFAISRAALAAYGGSQARGLIRAVATGLRQSHSNAGSEPHLQPTPQLTAMPDP